MAAKERRPLAVCAAVHGVMTGVLDRVHRHRLNRFDLLVPDGQPVRWAMNWLHRTKLTQRVYGPELMLRVERAAAEGACRSSFRGSGELLETPPPVQTATPIPGPAHGRRPPSRFRCPSPAEREELVQELRGSGAAIVFVGLGCPRQEVFTYEMGARRWECRSSPSGRRSTSTPVCCPRHRRRGRIAGWSGCSGSSRSRAGCGGVTFCSTRCICRCCCCSGLDCDVSTPRLIRAY